MKRLLGGVLGGLAFLAVVTVVFGYSIAQLFVGFKGIALGIGVVWAWVALIATLVLRFTLPITIGAFYGAIHVWGWPWYWAALFAAPGLLFMVPGLVALAVSFVSDIRSARARGSQ